MRRTTHSIRAFGAILLALAVVGIANDSYAQGPRRTLLIPLNGSIRLQTTSKKPLAMMNGVVVTKAGVLEYRQVVTDPSTIILIGQTADITQLTLTDVDGKKDEYDVIVQIDVEYLKTQLR